MSTNYIMRTKKPSKQIYALLILAVTAIFCAIIFKKGNPFNKLLSSNDENPATAKIEISTATINELEDTDSDGLFDWEETLRGTDLKKGDTDNDGTSDGDEVKQERNPLVPGPDDNSKEPTDSSLLNEESPETGEGNINSTKTVSSELSKNLLTRLMYLKENDSLTEENKDAIVKDLTAFTVESFVYKKYTKDTLLLLENPTVEEIRIYASNFATIQVDLISNISEQGDAIVNDILVLSKIYRDTARKMSEIAIPKVLADIHLNIVNNYSAVSRSLETFKDDNDPAQKTVSIGAYQNASENQDQMLNIIANYLEQNGIIFSSDQIGDYWNNFY